MNQLYNQVSGHIVGYIGFLTNNMANYLIAVLWRESLLKTHFYIRRIDAPWTY